MPGVSFVGLGVPLAAAQRGGVSRLTQMRGNPGRGQLLGHIPPPRAPLHREPGIPAAGEPRQPGPQMLPVSRRDLATPHLPGHGVEIVEGDLLPVNIQPAYDGHRDLLTLPRAPQAPHTRMAYESIVTRLSWGGPSARTGTALGQTVTPTRRCMSSDCFGAGDFLRSGTP